MNNDQLYSLIDKAHITLNCDMRAHTSLQIGGPADILVDAHSREEILRAQRFAAENQLPLTVIGRGSNLLIGDKGIRGLVLRIAKGFSQIEQTREHHIYAQSGATLKALALFAQEHSLSGLSFASGIPGTVGGGVVMNAGAYGAEMKDVVEYVDIVDAQGNLCRCGNPQMDFSYRSSRLQNSGSIVLGAGFVLRSGNAEEIAAQTQELNRRRAEKQPLHLPSCGSAFKRPEGNYASALIEQCGLKGFRLGRCAVSDKHSGFLVNDRGASAAEYLALIRHVQQEVKRQTGYELELEVKQVGEF